MRRRERAIPWEALNPNALSKSQRAIVGGDWLARMKQEHLAVGAFSMLAIELAKIGADSIVLSLIARAASDEVRHADICKRFAQIWLGERAVPARLRGLPRIPLHAGVPERERSLLHVVEMCCFNETFTGAFFSKMLETTTDPTARATVESLLEDEIDHGRVGWAYLASAARQKWGLLTVSNALPALLERTVAKVIAPRAKRKPSERDDPALEAFAYLGPRAATRVYRETLADVILPGLETLGVDVTGARTLARARGWSS